MSREEIPQKYTKGLGMPYMGGKRKLAKPIIDHILKENPNAKYFYDLFGGGGAMSFNALQRPQFEKVFYNEFNTGVVALLEDIKKNGITDKYYQWIDRETFNENKTKDTWLGGLCKVVWSFGNNQKGYIFGKHIEDDKKLLHKTVVNKCKDSLEIFNKKHDINLTLESDGLFEETINQRRLRIKKVVKNRVAELQQLERLQQLQQLQQLEISNLSYEDVVINTPIEETIIYLDPPYKNTGKYEKDIDHDKLDEYIANSPYKIYVSGYDFDLPLVKEFEHRSTLSSRGSNKVIERLYYSKISYKKALSA